jgi:hypothetical protein
MLAIMAAVLISVGAVAAGVQAVNREEAQEQLAVTDQEASFWQVIAGEEPGTASNVSNHLARDLRAIINDDDALEAFRGHSNRYGGITSAIGFDPFDGTGQSCVECGPLSASTLANIRSIRDGNLDDVLGAVEVVEVDEGFTLTPFGWSVATTIALLWVFGGPATLLLAHKWAQSSMWVQHGHAPYVRSFADLKWDNNGKQQFEKLLLTITAPTFIFPWRFYQDRTRDRWMDKVRVDFPDQWAVIEQVNEYLPKVKDADRRLELEEQRDTVLAELESLTRAYGQLDRPLGRDVELDYLMEGLERARDDLKMRREVRDEVDSW